ncbi:hypothetical protein MHH33_07100 [Paenisporosarcina sp. FSL H8-0542]|uniref:hypothetical protein n=1 Tax=Paenisporosarcina sp. FSL H8-0542 TaxID=2921401 RepID=UPI00315A262B
MRLREKVKLLQDNVYFLNVNHVITNNRYEITDFTKLYKSIKNIEGLGFLEEDIQHLNENLGHIFNDKSDRVLVDNEGLNSLIKIVNTMRVKVIAVIQALKESIPNQDENSVSIKLPPYTDLSQVSTFVKDIDKILNQSLINEYKSTVRFQNFDTGSSWIEIVLENQASVLFLGRMITSAYNFLQNQYLQLKQSQHTITALEIDSAAKQLVLKALEDNIKTQSRLNAKLLMDEFDINGNQNEYHGQLSHSIQKLAELLHKGTEIHTALNAPEETKQVFPDPNESRKLIENTVKLLPENPSEDQGVQEDTVQNDE